MKKNKKKSKLTQCISISILTLVLTATPSFGLSYTNKTNSEEMHLRACSDIFQATGQIVVLFQNGSTISGTATLIAPDVVLTAAHILRNDHGLRVKSVNFQPYPIATFYNYGLKPKNIWIHPKFNPKDRNLKNDIALVQLAKPIINVRPAELQKTIPFNLISRPVTAIGYGQYGKNKKRLSNDNKRRAGDILVSLHPIDASELVSEFELNRRGQYVTGPYDSKYRAFIEKGDSGGPLFIKIKGEKYPRLVGITRGEVTETTTMNRRIVARSRKMVFQSIPHYYPWIQSKLNNA